MYKCFKDCLLSPGKIVNYLDLKTKKIVLYVVILLCLYTIPFCVSFMSSFGGDRKVMDSLVDDFESSETINYRIEEGLLQCDKDITQTVNLEGLSNRMGYNVIVVFGNNEKLNIELKQNQFYVIFRKDHIEVVLALYDSYDGTVGGGQSQLSVIKGSTDKITLVEFTYEKLGLKNINFAKDSDNFDFELVSVYNRIIDDLRIPVYIFGSIGIIVVQTISLLFSLLMVSVLLRIFNRMLNISFTTILKICIFSSTIMVVGKALSLCLNSDFIASITYLIFVIYVLIAMRMTDLLNRMQQKKFEKGEKNEL